MDLTLLAEPFVPEDIEWRLAQAGKKKDGTLWAKVLAYVTSRAVQQRFDDVCGPERWQNEFRPAPDGGVLCRIGVYTDGGVWVWKEDGAENTDIEGVKGGLSGAMKRAAVQWGVGRYLYDLPEGWAVIRDNGAHSGKTKEGDWFRWDPPTLPAWAVPKPSVAAPLATDAQLELIGNLMKSHLVTPEERGGIERRLGVGMSRKQASECVDWLQSTIATRKESEREPAGAA